MGFRRERTKSPPVLKGNAGERQPKKGKMITIVTRAMKTSRPWLILSGVFLLIGESST